MHMDSLATSKSRSFCNTRGHSVHLGHVPSLSFYNLWLPYAGKGLLNVCTTCLRWELQFECAFPFQIPRSVVTNTLTVHSLWAGLHPQLISSSHYWCRLWIKKHATISQWIIPSAYNSMHRALPHWKIGPCMRPSHWGKFSKKMHRILTVAGSELRNMEGDARISENIDSIIVR